MATLSNNSIALEFKDGHILATNRLAGSLTRLACPGVALSLGGEAISFTDAEVRARDGEVLLTCRDAASGISAAVRYWLEGEEPWFRKQVTLQAPPGTPTPGRLLVDRQPEPPLPLRRVGYGLRGGPASEEVIGLDTYANTPGCGYPVYAGEWFFGLEHPVGFAVPGETLELYHHPVWDEQGRITSFPAVFGVGRSHVDVPCAFMDYIWQIRNPRLAKPFIHVTTGWSTRSFAPGEYVDSFEGREAFVDAMLRLGLRPTALGIDAGWFERASMYHAKGDDDRDTRMIAFRHSLQERGLKLSVWVSHNGRTGFDMDWIQGQGWEIGEGPGSYSWGQYVVMMQPEFEAALGQRFRQIVGPMGADHLKIDWDNECATNEHFSERYPTPDHVREASVLVFNRLDARMRKVNPDLITRNGWWPSPWWLKYADHVWLVDSGDCEFIAWPSRTQRDRDITHRDAMYYHITRKAETPFPLDGYDNHGFADALDNCFTTERHTWLDNAVLSALRGTTYIHFPLCPEAIRQWQADMLQGVLDWWEYHADELGGRESRMVLGNPAQGEVYGFLHPCRGGAWLALRNPSPEPQGVRLFPEAWLGYDPMTTRQIYPYYQDTISHDITLLGHEVRVLQFLLEAAPPMSPLEGVPFLAEAVGDGFRYSFPGNRPLGHGIGPVVHPDMQIPDLTAEEVSAAAVEGGFRRQWYAGVPHRMEQAELFFTTRGPHDLLDRVQVRAGTSRYRGDVIRESSPLTRIFRGEKHGYGTRVILPPLEPRARDDYLMPVPDGGWTGLTVELLGPGVETLGFNAWLTGFESPARQTLKRPEPPVPGPLLPSHPYGFSRVLKL